MNDAAPLPAAASAVLQFWLGDGLEKGWPSQDLGGLWFGGDAALDERMRQRFGTLVQQAQAGDLVDWETQPLTRLALVLLLDQFSRNVYRGQPQAFAGDARAQRLVVEALDRQADMPLPWVGRLFMRMPLMHAEDLALQERCVQCFTDLVNQAPPALKSTFEDNLKYAHQHQGIVARFGRFPHRNAVLGRTCTPQELDYLQHGPRFGQ
jgi:uncharacterized protein (DUF924 family)